MKKLIAALLLLVLAFTCFVACGDETTVTLDDAKTYLQNMLNADDGKETPRDYNVVAKIIIEGVSFDVTWTTDNDEIQVTESDKAIYWKIDVPESNATAVNYKLTATIKNADGESVQISFNRKLPVYDNAGIVSDLQENTAYRFFMYQANKQNYYFALAEIDSQGKYYETTTTAADAADFYAEKSGEGYKFYTLIDGTKNYVDAYLDITTADDGTTKTSKRLQFSTDDGDVWTYNGETNGWYTTIDGTQYVIGTYGTYTTFSISEGTYLSKDNTGKSQFPAGFMTPAYAESLKPSEGPTIYTTPEEIVNAAYALEKGAMLSGGYQYTLTGVITAVNTPYDSGYGNVTVTIVVGDMTDKPIECFRLSGTGADVIAVGDEITVTGEILKYDNQTETGKVEFNSGCTLVAYPGSDNVTPGPDTPSDKTWGVVTELKTGDQVLIGAPAYGKLLSVTKVATYYNAGIDYSPTNFANVTDDEIFVVTVNDDGSYTFTSLSGKVIALAAEFSSLNDAGENKSWTLEAKEGATGVYYMKNVARGNYLEWYAEKDNWSTFNGTLSDLFELSFYAIGGTVTPDNGGNETPDQGGDNTDTPTTDAPVADTAYKFAVAQNSLGKTLYFTGATESETVTYRLALTENVAEAVDVYVELVDGVEGAYKLYFMNGETKTYIVAAEYQDGDAGYGKGTITFETATDLYYTYDATAKTLIYTADADNSYYLGTYGTFTTISCSNTSFITGNNAANVDATQFPARLVVVSGDGGNEAPDTHEHNYVDGKCECGAEDPNYVPDQGGDNTDTPVIGGNTTTFDSMTLNDGKDSSYLAERTNTDGWKATNARIDSSDSYTWNGTAITGVTILTINGKTTAVGTLTSPVLNNGITSLSFNYAYLFSESNGVNITINIKNTDGDVVATHDLVVANADVVKLTAYEYTWTLDTAVEGDFVIEILNNSPSNSDGNKDRLGLWNITWTNPEEKGDDTPVVSTNKDDFATVSDAASSYYEDRTSESGWTAHNAAFNTGRTDPASDSNPYFPSVLGADGAALTIKSLPNDKGTITSPTLTGGIASLSFNYAHLFTEANGINLTINIKNAAGEVVATHDLVVANADVVKLTAYEYTWTLDTAVEGDFVIEFVNNAPTQATSGNKDRVSIWNVTWTNPEAK